MDSTAAPPETVAPPSNLTLIQRVIAVFIGPSRAWGGLKEHAQWWFPMVVVTILSAAIAAGLHQRALVPMMLEAWDKQVADGSLSAEQVDKMEQFFSQPVGLAITTAQQALLVPILTLLAALIIWFAVGFVLGTRMKYRLALEVAAWSALITIPGAILTFAMAWSRETMRGIHTGFGILLPDTEAPSKIQVALGGILDALGPLSIWYLIVLVIGASALSGAPRKPVAWTLGTLYLVLMVIFSALGAAFVPAA